MSKSQSAKGLQGSDYKLVFTDIWTGIEHKD